MTYDHNWQLDSIVQQLREARSEWRTAQGRTHEPGDRELPSKAVMQHIIEMLAGAMFPMRLGPSDLRKANEDFYVGHTLDLALNALLQQAVLELRHTHRKNPLDANELLQQAGDIIRGFAAELPALRRILDTDVMAAYHGDPAAKSVDEVLLCYPGVMAIIHHRIAHYLYKQDSPCWRVLSVSWPTRIPALIFTLARRLGQVSLLTTVRVWSLAKPPSLVSGCVSIRR